MNSIIRILFLFFCFLNISQGKEIPSLNGPVLDEAHLLSSEESRILSQKLIQYERKTSDQIQLYIIKSLEDESLEGFSIKVVDKWKLGKKEKDNGVLFLISVDDHKMRIEVGRGLEGNLTDLTTGRILEHIKPYFRQDKFYLGIDKAIDLMISSIDNQGETPKELTKKRHTQTSPFLYFIIFILWIVISSLKGRSRGYYYSGRGGPFGSSSGGMGGSSWSGGGGGFSGGGSSSNW